MSVNPDEALKAYSAALSIDPEHSDAHKGLLFAKANKSMQSGKQQEEVDVGGWFDANTKHP